MRQGREHKWMECREKRIMIYLERIEIHVLEREGGGGKNVCISLSQSFYNRQNPCIVLTPGFISRLMCSLPSYHSPLLTTIKHTTCNKVTSAGKHGAVAKNNNNKYTVYKMLHHSGLRYMTRTRVGFCCCCCFVSLCGTNNDVLITLTWTQTKTCS